MDIQNEAFRYLYVPGVLNILFGVMAISYSIEWIRVDSSPDWSSTLWIFAFATLGSILFQIGVGICIAWTTVPDAPEVATADLCRIAVTSHNEKGDDIHPHSVYASEYR